MEIILGAIISLSFGLWTLYLLPNDRKFSKTK